MYLLLHYYYAIYSVLSFSYKNIWILEKIILSLQRFTNHLNLYHYDSKDFR